MRLKRIYRSKLSIDDLHRNIRRNMSPEPSFSGNDFTFFFEMNKALRTTRSLWYSTSIPGTVKIRSTDVFHWPINEISFKPVDSGTEVTINYKGALVACMAYGIFLGAFVTVIGFLVTKELDEPLRIILPFLAFGVPMGLLPLLFRKIQSNIITQLEYS
ncbi:MAG: hypothetical protein RIE59_16545 [Imperialibacter sp.]